jgi:hypothetical protein
MALGSIYGQMLDGLTHLREKNQDCWPIHNMTGDEMLVAIGYWFGKCNVMRIMLAASTARPSLDLTAEAVLTAIAQLAIVHYEATGTTRQTQLRLNEPIQAVQARLVHLTRWSA